MGIREEISKNLEEVQRLLEERKTFETETSAIFKDALDIVNKVVAGKERECMIMREQVDKANREREELVGKANREKDEEVQKAIQDRDERVRKANQDRDEAVSRARKERDEAIKESNELVAKANQERDQALLFMVRFKNCIPDLTEINKWQGDHLTHKHADLFKNPNPDVIPANGLFSYSFVPTKNGTFAFCKCTLCGEEYDFSNI